MTPLQEALQVASELDAATKALVDCPDAEWRTRWRVARKLQRRMDTLLALLTYGPTEKTTEAAR